jgi:hypothetical protein
MMRLPFFMAWCVLLAGQVFVKKLVEKSIQKRGAARRAITARRSEVMPAPKKSGIRGNKV